MEQKRKLLIGGVALVMGNVRNAGEAMVAVCDELDPILIESGWFPAAPFKYISLIIRYGVKTDLKPEFQPIIKKYGELPVAIVMGIALSGYPLEVLLAQATVENRSDKTVTAVKLAWKVHGFTKGIVPHDLLCGVPSEGKVFLSGNTPLISLGQLAPTETCHIGQKPLVGKAPATHTVFIDYPILSADDVKSLPVDETRRADKYAIALYVSEIHYADGTTWAFVKQPSPG